MRIVKPFTPVEVTTEGLSHTVSVIGRSITLGADSMPTSIVTQGHELLSGPMRLVGSEDGEETVWDVNYPDNESECFVQSRSDEAAVLCGAMQSERFVVDTCFTVGFDGCVNIDLKLMPRGRTVAQIFGTGQTKPLTYRLDRLWLEIPLKGELVTMYSMFPNTAIKLADGGSIARTETTSSGLLPGSDMLLPFKSLLWLGCDDYGLGWFAENDKNWQPADRERAVEVVRDGDSVVLRVHLLDSQPESWTDPPERGLNAYFPVTFRFGLQATPVKPFPATPYLHNALHIDCFRKIKGNYYDFLAAEGRFDRLAEKGVTTLILHEKWNKSQNWFELSEYTTEQIKKIVAECHRRGIKVLTYFGYEVSTLSPSWAEYGEKVAVNIGDGKLSGGWYRVPFQRDYKVCYNNEWADRFVSGVTNIMDTCHTDGVYLDGTAFVSLCSNTSHGCGWYDRQGVLHGTYPLMAVRDMFRRLYEEVEARGGMINVHSYGCANFTALPYIHQTWYGENLQFGYIKGSLEKMPLGYFRAEYTGRNMGVPVEFIAYENRPIWNFENAVACALIHGILPRPNDIEYPLELISGIWKLIGNFPTAKSEWLPYWRNGVAVSDDRMKVSYYKHETLAGDAELLVFCANTSADELTDVSIKLPESFERITDLTDGGERGASVSLGKFGYKILYVR